MKIYFILIILILLCYSCKKDITGHWHAKSIKYNYSMSIDIDNNNDCYSTSELRFESSKGKHFPQKKRIFFPGTCGESDFKYYTINNTLYLESALGFKLSAKKMICNRVHDYKTALKIDFLELKNLVKDSIYNTDLNEYINIGHSKKDSTLKIEISSSLNLQDIFSLDSLPYKITPYYSDKNRPLINYILTPDKNLKASTFNTILEKLNKSGKKRIFIRTLKDSLPTTERDIFEYIRIKEDRFDFNSDKPLFEIIN